MPSLIRHKLILLQALVILLVGSWVYWPALHGDWLWDDTLYIRDNPAMHDPGRLWKVWVESGISTEYYPLAESVQWVQWQLWGNHTLGYHLTNLVLHLVSTLLVWRLLDKFGLRLAWVGALLFAFHPVQVETVAWISELKSTLSTPPFLLAMICWINYEEKKQPRDYWLSLALFLIAMLCKISMAPFPVMILLYAWWKRGQIGWNDLKISAPFFAIPLVLGSLGAWLQGAHVAHATAEISWWVRLDSMGWAAVFFLMHCVFPVNLMPVYPSGIVTSPGILDAFPWLLIGGLLAVMWHWRQSWGRHALLGFVFFLVMIAPPFVFIFISPTTMIWVLDHLLYVPIIGIIGLVVAGLDWVEERLPHSLRHYVLGIAAVMTLPLAADSHHYAALYLNQETLWRFDLAHNPEAWIAHDNLANTLMQKGELDEAMEHYQRVIELKPDFPQAENNLGLILAGRGQLNEAMAHYQKALQINPGFVEAESNLGNAFFKTGRLDEALAHYQKALQLDPTYAPAESNLGNALMKAGRVPEAIEHYQRALQLDPNSANAHSNLGVAFYQSGNIAGAMEQFEAALKINPDQSDARKNLARVQAMENSGRTK